MIRKRSLPPEDLDELRLELRAAFPTLQAFINGDGLLEIAGAFPVEGPAGELLDSFNISVVVPAHFPDELPVVREVSGRIPRTPDRHVEPDGRACIAFPDDRWRFFPDGSSLIDFLRVPVFNFFLSQSHWEACGEWPFDEWAHAEAGIIQYYRELVGTEEDAVAVRFLDVLARRELKGHWDCPCGSGARIRDCCRPIIEELRRKVHWKGARRSYERLGRKHPA